MKKSEWNLKARLLICSILLHSSLITSSLASSEIDRKASKANQDLLEISQSIDGTHLMNVKALDSLGRADVGAIIYFDASITDFVNNSNGSVIEFSFQPPSATRRRRPWPIIGTVRNKTFKREDFIHSQYGPYSIVVLGRVSGHELVGTQMRPDSVMRVDVLAMRIGTLLIMDERRIAAEKLRVEKSGPRPMPVQYREEREKGVEIVADTSGARLHVTDCPSLSKAHMKPWSAVGGYSPCEECLKDGIVKDVCTKTLHWINCGRLGRSCIKPRDEDKGYGKCEICLKEEIRIEKELASMENVEKRSSTVAVSDQIVGETTTGLLHRSDCSLLNNEHQIEEEKVRGYKRCDVCLKE